MSKEIDDQYIQELGDLLYLIPNINLDNIANFYDPKQRGEKFFVKLASVAQAGLIALSKYKIISRFTEDPEAIKATLTSNKVWKLILSKKYQEPGGSLLIHRIAEDNKPLLVSTLPKIMAQSTYPQYINEEVMTKGIVPLVLQLDTPIFDLDHNVEHIQDQEKRLNEINANKDALYSNIAEVMSVVMQYPPGQQSNQEKAPNSIRALVGIVGNEGLAKLFDQDHIGNTSDQIGHIVSRSVEYYIEYDKFFKDKGENIKVFKKEIEDNQNLVEEEKRLLLEIVNSTDQSTSNKLAQELAALTKQKIGKSRVQEEVVIKNTKNQNDNGQNFTIFQMVKEWVSLTSDIVFSITSGDLFVPPLEKQTIDPLIAKARELGILNTAIDLMSLGTNKDQKKYYKEAEGLAKFGLLSRSVSDLFESSKTKDLTSAVQGLTSSILQSTMGDPCKKAQLLGIIEEFSRSNYTASEIALKAVGLLGELIKDDKFSKESSVHLKAIAAASKNPALKISTTIMSALLLGCSKCNQQEREVVSENIISVANEQSEESTSKLSDQEKDKILKNFDNSINNLQESTSKLSDQEKDKILKNFDTMGHNLAITLSNDSSFISKILKVWCSFKAINALMNISSIVLTKIPEDELSKLDEAVGFRDAIKTQICNNILDTGTLRKSGISDEQVLDALEASEFDRICTELQKNLKEGNKYQSIMNGWSLWSEYNKIKVKLTQGIPNQQNTTWRNWFESRVKSGPPPNLAVTK